MRALLFFFLAALPIAAHGQAVPIMASVLDATGKLLTAAQPTPPVAMRAPAAGDDVTSNYAIGNDWLTPAGQIWQNASATAGLALWQNITPGCLPLDCIGLTTTAATKTTAGTGYVTGNIVEGTHGDVLTVTASGGAVTALAVTTPNFYGCASGGTYTGETFTSLTGTGTGLVATLTLAYPHAIGTDLLTNCYAGKDLNVQRADTGAAMDIGFVNGSFDTATAWRFGANTTLRIGTAYDQGGAGNNDTQTTAAYQPAISPLRRWMDSVPTIICDGSQVGNYTGPLYTFLNVSPSVSVILNAVTVGMAFGNESTARKQNLLQFNGLYYLFSNTQNGLVDGFTYLTNGLQLDQPQVPFDEGNVAILAGSAAGTNFELNGFTSSTTGNPGSSSNGTGYICSVNSSSQAGYADIRDLIIEPRTLTAAEQSALQAALYATTHEPPQNRNVIVVLGDSHEDGTGAVLQQSWPRQLKALLNRPDVNLINAAEYGNTALSEVMTFLPIDGTPALTNSSSPYWRNKLVILDGGVNDFAGTNFTASFSSGTMSVTSVGFNGQVQRGWALTGTGVASTYVTQQLTGTTGGVGTYATNGSLTIGSGETITETPTPAQLYVVYQSAAASVHAAGGRFVCATDVLRNNSPTTNASVASLNSMLEAGCPSFADGLIDFTVLPAFNVQVGSWPAPLFTSDGVHLTAYGQAQQAAIAYQQLRAQNLILQP